MTSAALVPHVEVAIIGAGPAGLACAIAAAQLGLHVEIIDAMHPAIDKACGEGLMPDSLAALTALGLDLTHLHTPETALLRGIRFLDEASHATTEAAFPQAPGRGIRRTVLHQLLLDRAIALGVRFHWETVVQGITQRPDATEIHTNRFPLRTRYLIGADGHNSRVAH
jgi:2-polyprenyl-6-methoxyphenol hydroxylase-like FAD-dependent oxidoreductase